MRRSILVAASALLVAWPYAGCGRDEDPLEGFAGRDRAVAATVLAYGTAARTGDAKAVCDDILARAAKAPLGRECVRRVTTALRGVTQHRIDVVAVRFEGDTAIATVVTGAGKSPRSGALALVQEDGLWRIARVGPLPPPGADAGS